jgi:hypothetical protein
MTVIWYENIEDIPLNLLNINNWDISNNVPWINTTMLDANTSIENIPEWKTPTPDILWWSTDIVWSATDNNTIQWTSGNIKLADWTSYSINNGNTGDITWINYIYYDWTTTLKKTTIPQDAVGAGKIMVAVCKPVTDTAGKAIIQPFGTVWTDVFITADNIAANTITTNQLAANAIDGMTITGALVRTAASWVRSQLSSNYFSSFDSNYERIRLWDTGSRLQFRDSNWNDCWFMTWLYVSIFGWYYTIAFSKPISTTIWVFTNWIISWWSLYPDNDWNLDIWNGYYRWNNLYLNWWVNFDNWDGILTEVSWTPRWSNWINYWILMSDGTTSTSNLSADWKISVNIAGSTFKLLYNNT